VARALGGGGHDRAAAALIVGAQVDDVKRQVQRLLPEIVVPLARVSEIMSFGVQTIPADTPVSTAAQQMQRTGHEGFPVVDPQTGAICGLLTRNAVDRAINHGMNEQPVSRFMQVGSVTVRPSESIERVQDLMLREKWGQIPVLAEDQDGSAGPSQPIGIVTRTDLLNYWFQPSSTTAQPDMRALLSESMSAPLWAMVRTVGEAAGELAMPLYFVGGPVRDLLLHISPTDLDMVVEGDAIVLGEALQRRFGGEVHTHARFGTAKWSLTPEIWRAVQRAAADASVPEVEPDYSALPPSIDFVTARFEFYTEPSALPEVERGSIKLDLHRRDFTINTLAVRLDGIHLGELLDFYGGRRDLELGLIRVLHSLSFVDDPTRILRAVRFEQRLGFAIEERTLELIDNALPMLARVTGQRIRHELELSLREADPLRVMERLSELNVMVHIQPGLTWTPEAKTFYERVQVFRASTLWADALPADSVEFLYFALWLEPLPAAVQRATARRLRVRRTTSDDVLAVRRLVDQLLSFALESLPSEVSIVCRDFPSRVLLAARIVLDGEPQGALLDAYYREWRHVKPDLSGDDLREIGLPPGPIYTRILDALLAARLDGQVADEAEERALLADLLRGDGGESLS
jgi:tRNA nucleotidyltransferase (CCA-adding enzyme)